MEATAVLERLKGLGVSVSLAGDRLRMEPGSKVPGDLFAEVEAHKEELRSLLTKAEAEATVQDADDLLALEALGKRLRNREIKAIRCGITGKVCVICGGVPCRGSQPIE